MAFRESGYDVEMRFISDIDSSGENYDVVIVDLPAINPQRIDAVNDEIKRLRVNSPNGFFVGYTVDSEKGGALGQVRQNVKGCDVILSCFKVKPKDLVSLVGKELDK